MVNLTSKKLVIGLIISAATVFSGCTIRSFNSGGSSEDDSDTFERVPGQTRTPTQTTVNDWIAKSPGVLLDINLENNTVIKYISGLKTDTWPAMTGDTDGGEHGGAKKSTPTGVFQVHAVDFCPPYNTKGIAGCAPGNPFGKYNMRFHMGDVYGAHGTNLADQKFYAWDEDDRRVSGGCIRNPSDKIYETVHDVLRAANPAWEAELTAMPIKVSSTILKRWKLSTSLPMGSSSYIIVHW